MRGFVFFSPNPAWVADAANNPATAQYNYSVRVRVSSGVAGVVARFTTSYVGENYLQPSQTSYYAVLLDADATDTSPGASTAVSIVKYTAGAGLTTLATATARLAVSFGVTLARGRWYTVTAVTSPAGIQAVISDDSIPVVTRISANGTTTTGAPSLVLSSSDATLPPGPPGLYADGIADFDDLRVATSCAASDGACRSATSNTATGLGSVCAYTCPLGYVASGSFLRVSTSCV